MLPKDPVLLLSVVNMKLRDEYGSLDELCAALNEERPAIEGVPLPSWTISMIRSRINSSDSI